MSDEYLCQTQDAIPGVGWIKAHAPGVTSENTGTLTVRIVLEGEVPEKN